MSYHDYPFGANKIVRVPDSWKPVYLAPSQECFSAATLVIDSIPNTRFVVLSRNKEDWYGPKADLILVEIRRQYPEYKDAHFLGVGYWEIKENNEKAADFHDGAMILSR